MRCILCGLPLDRPTPWWARLLGLTPPPIHDPDSREADACWVAFRTRVGLNPDTPRPVTPRRRRIKIARMCGGGIPVLRRRFWWNGTAYPTRLEWEAIRPRRVPSGLVWDWPGIGVWLTP